MIHLELERDEAAALYQLLVRHDAVSLGFEGPRDGVLRINRVLDRLRGRLLEETTTAHGEPK